MTLHRKGELFDLICKDPGELGFIIQEKDYDAYIETFTSIGGSAEDAPYTREEFNTLKEFFGSED